MGRRLAWLYQLSGFRREHKSPMAGFPLFLYIAVMNGGLQVYGRLPPMR